MDDGSVGPASAASQRDPGAPANVSGALSLLLDLPPARHHTADAGLPLPGFEIGDHMMEVSDILASAQEAVKKAQIDDSLKPVAFEKAVDLLAASAGLTSGKEHVPSAAASGSAAGTTSADGTLLGKVASKLKLDVATVKEVLHEEDGKFDVIVSPGALEKAKSTGMKQLALLVAVARQGAELEEFTEADHIRYFADTFGKYDEGNFATDLKSMTEEFRIRRDGRKILVKLSRPGWDAAAALVRRLAGED